MEILCTHHTYTYTCTYVRTLVWQTAQQQRQQRQVRPPGGAVVDPEDLGQDEEAIALVSGDLVGGENLSHG